MTTVKGHFSCDNSYAVWLGDEEKVHTKLLEATNTDSRQIWRGESVEFEAVPECFLYLVAWSDDRVKQGLIGTFTGAFSVHTGDPRWRVLATGQNLGNRQFPAEADINRHLSSASPSDWRRPFVGPTNENTSSIYNANVKVNNIPDDANWVWHNSGKNTRHPNNPFQGFNHDEFLIFRIPCNVFLPCADFLAMTNANLHKACSSKPFTIHPENKQELSCSAADLPDLKPYFTLHWGDGKSDIMETHDDECLYIAAHNPYSNLTFHDVKIIVSTVTDVNGNPVRELPNGTPSVQIKPSQVICFGDLKPCDPENPKVPTTVCREVVLISQNAEAGSYFYELETCFQVMIKGREHTRFKLELKES